MPGITGARRRRKCSRLAATIFRPPKKLDAQGYVIADLIVCRSDFGKEYPDAVTGFLRAYGNALTMFKTKPADAVAIVAKQAGVTPEVAKRDMDKYDFVTFERQLSADWLGSPARPANSPTCSKAPPTSWWRKRASARPPRSTRSRRRSTRPSWRRRARPRTRGLSCQKAKREGASEETYVVAKRRSAPCASPIARGDGLSLRLEPGKQLVRHVTEPFVEFSKLSIEYPSKEGAVHALDAIDLTFGDGDFICVVGPPAAARPPFSRPSPGSSCPLPAA